MEIEKQLRSRIIIYTAFTIISTAFFFFFVYFSLFEIWDAGPSGKVSVILLVLLNIIAIGLNIYSALNYMRVTARIKKVKQIRSKMEEDLRRQLDGKFKKIHNINS